MTFLQHKRKKQSKAILAISIFALFALIFILLKAKITEGPLSSLFVKLNLPRQAEGKAENTKVLFLNTRIESLESENKILNAALGEKIQKEIPAQIKLGGGYLFSDILLLNKGKGVGLKQGDLVFAKDKIYIGKILETGENWSKVQPIGSFGEKIIFRTGKDKEIAFEAVGAGRGELLAQLPKDTVIAVGDIIWLGEAPEYPVGLVSGIRKSEGREMQDVRITSPLSLSSLIDVMAVKSQ
ncbi:MAG: rod shape-determining protein MreC [bacterium]|nr:rod shape-determining protein MreC [bacterium]